MFQSRRPEVNQSASPGFCNFSWARQTHTIQVLDLKLTFQLVNEVAQRYSQCCIAIPLCYHDHEVKNPKYGFSPRSAFYPLWHYKGGSIQWQDLTLKVDHLYMLFKSIWIPPIFTRQATTNINPYSAGIDFRHQNLTSVNDPRSVRIKIFLMAVEP